MQQIFKTIQDIEKAIYQRPIGKTHPMIISVDGKDGSGKSSLALCLCCQNEDFIYFDIDSHYWILKQLPYVENLTYQTLKTNINNALNIGEHVVIDSICNLEILERIDLTPTIKIYIKEVDNSGRWIKGCNFDYSCDLETQMQERKRVAQCPLDIFESDSSTKNEVNSTYSEDLTDEVIRYHHKYKPDKNADIIFERISKIGA